MLTNKIKAFMSLLDDSDEIVYGAVRAALLREGDVVMPALIEAASSSPDSLRARRACDMLRIVGLKSLECSLTEWIDDGAENLLYGAFLVAKYIYPQLEYSEINDLVNTMWRSLRKDVKSVQKPLERVRVVNKYIFEEQGFSKNISNPTIPENNCINEVLMKTKGNHITLSILYSELCRRIGLPVCCVSLPKILILCYLNDTVMDDDMKLCTDDIMFYINPANKGAIVGREDIKTFLNIHKVETLDSYYLPCDNIEVIRRLLINLQYSFMINKESGNVDDMKALIKMIDVKKNSIKTA